MIFICSVENVRAATDMFPFFGSLIAGEEKEERWRPGSNRGLYCFGGGGGGGSLFFHLLPLSFRVSLFSSFPSSMEIHKYRLSEAKGLGADVRGMVGWMDRLKPRLLLLPRALWITT
jgi:hypothetical protein